MRTQYEIVLQEMRLRIVSGRWHPGSRLMEIPIALDLGVSRTPVRLALATLALEGLLDYAPKRGFVVKHFTAKQILDAVQVRGRLEALACELVAVAGLTTETSSRLETNLERTAELLALEFGDDEIATWSRLNAEFHDTIVAASGNDSLTRFKREVDAVPLAAAGSFLRAANLADRRKVVEDALFMHRLVFRAIRLGDAQRAGFLMEEHIRQGRDGLQTRLQGLIEENAAAADSSP